MKLNIYLLCDQVTSDMTNVSIMSSAEQYFRAGVLKEKSDISAGLGLPDPTLAGCLAVCWLLLYLTLKGDLVILDWPSQCTN